MICLRYSEYAISDFLHETSANLSSSRKQMLWAKEILYFFGKKCIKKENWSKILLSTNFIITRQGKYAMAYFFRYVVIPRHSCWPRKITIFCKLSPKSFNELRNVCKLIIRLPQTTHPKEKLQKMDKPVFYKKQHTLRSKAFLFSLKSKIRRRAAGRRYS